MSPHTRFHVERIDPDTHRSAEDALNSVLEDEALADLVDWAAIPVGRSGEYDVIIEYRPAAEDNAADDGVK